MFVFSPQRFRYLSQPMFQSTATLTKSYLKAACSKPSALRKRNGASELLLFVNFRSLLYFPRLPVLKLLEKMRKKQAMMLVKIILILSSHVQLNFLSKFLFKKSSERASNEVQCNEYLLMLYFKKVRTLSLLTLQAKLIEKKFLTTFGYYQ